jgi:hypothetical protein
MMSKHDREVKGAAWLQRLQEVAASKESLAEYTRRHGLKLSEAYRWTQNLRRTGQWPARLRKPAKSARSKRAVKVAAPRFTRVRILAQQHAVSSTPLRLQLQLANGRRAELVLSDAQQLPQVLQLLEQPA